jgi:hypothetical protein
MTEKQLDKEWEAAFEEGEDIVSYIFPFFFDGVKKKNPKNRVWKTFDPPVPRSDIEDTEWDAALLGFVLALAFWRGAYYYYRHCGMKKENPYPKRKGGRRRPLSETEWGEWERGYENSWGNDEVDCEKECTDALEGKRKKRYTRKDMTEKELIDLKSRCEG